MNRSWTLVLATLAWLPAQDADAGRERIRIADLRADVAFLASDELQGRAAGTDANDIAARYIAVQFERAGLSRVCEDGASWFQDFKVPKGPGRDRRETRNVIGWLEGSDPALRDQHLVVGAHFDHVGRGKFGSRGKSRDDDIHNGADDNASGTAGVLALARALTANPPRRSVLFMAFSAEELGLLGSQYYVRHPVQPLESCVAMLNLDMIGRSEDGYLFLGGVGTSPQWPDLVERHVDSKGLRVERGAGGRAPSDSTSFYQRDIPVLFFFTNVHEDYHRASDHAELLAYETQHRIVLAAYDVLREIGDCAERVEFSENDGSDMPADFMQRLMTPSRARDMSRQIRRRDR